MAAVSFKQINQNQPFSAIIAATCRCKVASFVSKSRTRLAKGAQPLHAAAMALQWRDGFGVKYSRAREIIRYIHIFRANLVPL